MTTIESHSKTWACMLWAVLVTASPGLAQAQAAKTAADGVYTRAQADRGNAIYQNNCAACHGGALQGEEENPPLSGKHFAAAWGGKPVAALFDFINSSMPLGQPGSLGSQGGADVVAYILSVNRFAAGQSELPADSTALGTITINKQ